MEHTVVPAPTNPRRLTVEHVALALIAVFAAFLYFWDLSSVGVGNTYYAAGVQSMSESLRNFFFLSFDGAGFVSVDKSPLGFWIQTLFVRVLGFSGVALMLPQALAAVASVLLLYLMVRRNHGSTAGLIAAAALALTPIFTAVARNNTIDMLLILSLLGSAWFALDPREDRRGRSIVLSLVMIGVAFNVKMLQAFLVLPAVITAALIGPRESLRRRLSGVAAGVALMLAVSFAWVAIVDLVPAASRPYVGSSTCNSAMELVFGHNGASRFSLDVPGGASPITSESGSPGLLRLLQPQLSGQIAWFIPIVLVGMFALWPLPNEHRRSPAFWLVWAVPGAAYFSITAGIFHRYYLATLAPAAAALVGITVARLTVADAGPGRSWRRFLLPVAVALGTATSAAIHVTSGDGWAAWVTPMVIVTGSAATVVLLAAVWAPASTGKDRTAHTRIGLVLAAVALVTAPAVWTVSPITDRTHAALPAAGPQSRAADAAAAPPTLGTSAQTELVTRLTTFLMADYDGRRFLAATPSAQILAADLMLETGIPVMAVGGFNGSDSILSLSEFQQSVAAGEVRYVVVPAFDSRTPPAGGPPAGERPAPPGSADANAEIFAWVATSGTDLTSQVWGDHASTGFRVYRVGE